MDNDEKKLKEEQEELKKKQKKQKKKKRKIGFTLIELLAVIIILGILMIIAIPSVTSYINNSRKSAYVDTIKEIIAGARNFVNSGNLEMYSTDTTYYIDYQCVSTENGSKSPYGDFDKAYILVTYDGQKYEYFFTGRDETGQGIRDIVKADTIDEDTIISDIKSGEITDDIGFVGRENLVHINESCTLDTSLPTVARIAVSENGGPRGGYLSIGDKFYLSLSEAVADVPTDNTETTIVVYRSIVENSFVTIEANKNINLKLQGCTIENQEEMVSGDSIQIFITNYGKLTLDDNGSLESNVIVIDNYGDLKISKGTLKSNHSNVTRNFGDMEISNGTFDNAVDDISFPAVINKANGNLTITGGNITSNSNSVWNQQNGTMTITGGTFNTLKKYNTIYNQGFGVLENVRISSEYDSPTIGLSQTGEMTIRSSNIGSKISDAIYNNGKISVIDSIISSDSSKSPALVTGETGESTISGDSSIIANNTNSIVNYGKTSIVNCDVETKNNDKPTIVNTSTGIINISGGTVKGASIALWNMGGARANITGGSLLSTSSVTAYNSGTITVDGTALIESPTASSPCIYNLSGSTLNINGGTVDATKSDAISNSGTVLITGGTISSSRQYYATILNNSGTVTMSGGTINSSNTNGISNYATVNISNGSINSIGSSASALVNQSGASMSVSGGSFESSSNSLWNKGTANVTGGTFTSTGSYVMNNERTLTLAGTTSASTNVASKYLIYNNTGGNLTVNNGNYSSTTYYVFYNKGTMILNDGNITSSVSNAAIYNYQGTLTINGGTVTKTNGGDAAYNSGGTATYVSGTCSPRNF